MSQTTSQHDSGQASHSEAAKKLGEMIKGVRFAMFTTVEADGSLHSRPMATQQVEFDGDLWFFTSASSPKVHEIEGRPQVNVSYAEPDKNLWVSVSGQAEFVKDAAKNRELWNPVLKAWFPDGLDDPELSLIKVHAHEAEYWDAPSSKLVRLVGLAKALATGQRDDQGKNEKLELD